jgi:uncharacterized protein (TIGR00255 family)
MTGFGNGRRETERLGVSAEIRTVNNRYLKVSVRCPDSHAPLEPQIEKLVREGVARGTVSVSVRVDPAGREGRYAIAPDVLTGYARRLSEVAAALRLNPPANISELLVLPGVVAENAAVQGDPADDWPLIEQVLREALAGLHEFRVTEGRSMDTDLRANLQIIAGQLDRVVELAPGVVEGFRDRLLERVRELLQTTDVQIDASDLIREVSVFSERADINEEMTRLRSHLEQFAAFLDQDESQGRKLDFLTQEMFREINTIGSKANTVPIAHCVIEMKAAAEKIREVLQNVE